MAGYVCPTCQRNAKLPDFCCGSSMIPSGAYYCADCKTSSTLKETCRCGKEMIQL